MVAEMGKETKADRKRPKEEDKTGEALKITRNRRAEKGGLNKKEGSTCREEKRNNKFESERIRRRSRGGELNSVNSIRRVIPRRRWKKKGLISRKSMLTQKKRRVTPRRSGSGLQKRNAN